jgi:hypothetical protein
MGNIVRGIYAFVQGEFDGPLAILMSNGKGTSTSQVTKGDGGSYKLRSSPEKSQMLSFEKVIERQMDCLRLDVHAPTSNHRHALA